MARKLIFRMATLLTALAAAAGLAPAAASAQSAAQVAGFDISASQGVPDFGAARAAGAGFVFVKDTAGVGYVNPNYLAQFRGAKAAGLYRSAYHYARPDKSTGAEQAAYLHTHDGKWFADGMTLPPALDLEDTPNVPPCYAMPPADLVAWIADFSAELTRRTGHTPIIYTTNLWWRTCTQNSTAFAADHVLWMARYNTAMGEVPGGWTAKFWQSAITGPLPGNQDTFFGTLDDLRALTAS
ncbi:GH25 family lysozyme M1 (1,4-beta-N-acetylmuramidase) [Amycolatopsis endophytica]|uniref:GH25 family lysozyme M1 (1,4-beta-N-acetylmuramidase) n=1 Tax=Amycolatopsis endophytica TaxID=860233 RepID=A0A853BAT6_9PSEU|nr:GH25 family lysozyme [Amycolatopsis endophytica]NYI92120.1 GH25 family lysozyme M1 (1,4-beta-N-acetylmuramidase) [Amycolatopsis endophytica]